MRVVTSMGTLTATLLEILPTPVGAPETEVTKLAKALETVLQGVHDGTISSQLVTAKLEEIYHEPPVAVPAGLSAEYNTEGMPGVADLSYRLMERTSAPPELVEVTALPAGARIMLEEFVVENRVHSSAAEEVGSIAD